MHINYTSGFQSRAAHWLLAVCLGLLAGCATFAPSIEPPEITVARFQVVDVQLLEQRYALTLRVQNPNDFTLPIRGLSFHLSFYGMPFAHGVSDQMVAVGPYSEALLDISVVSGTLNLMQQLAKLQGDQNQTIDYLLSGHLSLEDRLTRIPFEKRGSLNFKMLPNATP